MPQRQSQRKTVFFLGTPEFAVPSLQALMDSPEFDVILVITQPDKPVGRSQEITPPPVKVLAEINHIPVFQPRNVNKEWEERPVREKPDFLVVVAYGQILKENILQEPALAPVNVHASLLPRWRGASPIQHAILAGDRESGVTIQWMKQELDSGPILAQKSVKLDATVTQKSLHDELAKEGAELLLRTLQSALQPREQNDAEVTLCKKLSREDGIVNLQNMSATEIDRRVRALVPWPGVKTELFGQEVKLIETALVPSADALEVPCNGGSLYITKLQPPGKKPMTGAEWKRGIKA